MAEIDIETKSLCSQIVSVSFLVCYGKLMKEGYQALVVFQPVWKEDVAEEEKEPPRFQKIA